MPINSHAAFARPDWVMLGLPFEDGVVIYASANLSSAELEAVVPTLDADLGGWIRTTRDATRPITYYLRTTMADIVMARGADYGQALRTLLEHWQPTAPQRPALTPSVPALGS